jgi:hypothetical protein
MSDGLQVMAVVPQPERTVKNIPLCGHSLLFFFLLETGLFFSKEKK